MIDGVAVHVLVAHCADAVRVLQLVHEFTKSPKIQESLGDIFTCDSERGWDEKRGT